VAVEIAGGDGVEGIKLDGQVTELFDAATMPGIDCKMSACPTSREMHSTFSFPNLD
jgi:hypothetical protein